MTDRKSSFILFKVALPCTAWQTGAEVVAARAVGRW